MSDYKMPSQETIQGAIKALEELREALGTPPAPEDADAFLEASDYSAEVITFVESVLEMEREKVLERERLAEELVLQAALLWMEREKEEREMENYIPVAVARIFDPGTIGGAHNARVAIMLAGDDHLENCGHLWNIETHYGNEKRESRDVSWLMNCRDLQEDVALKAESMFRNKINN